LRDKKAAVGFVLLSVRKMKIYKMKSELHEMLSMEQLDKQ
jgi:hypothetical protein